jgi:alcohol dehydrogenase
LYSATPKGSFIPGLEFAGVVAARGDGADPRFAVGDAVFGLTRFGGYVSAINVPTVALRHLPLGWSFAEGAAYPVQALTAWYGLVTLGAVTRDHVVLVQSAAGGVGLNALTILRALGARTVAVVGNEAKREWLQRERGLSRDAIVVRDRAGFPGALDRVLSRMGVRGFNVVFDAVSGPYFQPAYTRLLPEGRYVVYGAADFMTRGTRRNWWHLARAYLSRPRVDPLHMVSDNRSVMGFNLIWLWDKAPELSGLFDAMAPVFTAPPHVGRTFSFGDAPAAMRYLQGGGSVGKVVLESGVK